MLVPKSLRTALAIPIITVLVSSRYTDPSYFSRFGRNEHSSYSHRRMSQLIYLLTLGIGTSSLRGHSTGILTSRSIDGCPIETSIATTVKKNGLSEMSSQTSSNHIPCENHVTFLLILTNGHLN